MLPSRHRPPRGRPDAPHARRPPPPPAAVARPPARGGSRRPVSPCRDVAAAPGRAAAVRGGKDAVRARPPPPQVPPPVTAEVMASYDRDGETVIVGRQWWDYRSWTNRGKGLLLLYVLVLLCATNWVVVKTAQADLPTPAAFTAARFTVAALAFAPFLPRATAASWVAGLELGVWSAAGYGAQAVGLLTCDASRASFLSAFTVVVVPLLSGLTGARVPLLTWACAGAAMVGVYLLEGGGASVFSGGAAAAADAGPLFAAGDAWSLVSALTFAIQIWRTEARAKAAAPGQTLPLLAVTVATVAALSAAGAAAADPAGAASLLASPAAALAGARALDWGPILWTGLATTDGVLLIELVALRWVTSTDAAITYTLEPVLGALCAWLVLGERFGAGAFAGAAMILSAAMASSLSEVEEEGP